ncbi:hypothetical protein KY348_01070 [Candidatus Woesearchaeota archaeon]|nr:hypothetical protein [Candidatus Woesearchaeota archaeon]
MRKKLHAKGWSKEEIDRAKKIIKKAEKNKHPHTVKLENSLYWFTLIIGILGTILFSLVLVPILVVNTTCWGYVLTGLFGFLLGALVIIIIKDLHWLEQHHHLLISLLIPVVAIFNFFIVVKRVNMITMGLGLNNYHNPILTGVIYLACFIIPYIIFLLLKRK